MEALQEKTAQALAEDILGAFERKQRDSGESYWTCDYEGNDWRQDVMMAAHGDMLPDDYRYELIHDALCLMRDADDLDQLEYASDNWEPDTSYYAMAQWLGSHTERFGLCDEVINDGVNGDMADIIQDAQRREMQEVYSLLLQALNEQIN